MEPKPDTTKIDMCHPVLHTEVFQACSLWEMLTRFFINTVRKAVFYRLDLEKYEYLSKILPRITRRVQFKCCKWNENKMVLNPKEFQKGKSGECQIQQRAPQRKHLGFPLNLTFSDLIVLRYGI